MDKYYENLIEELNKATEAYDKGEPYLSDKEWDALYYHIVAMEEKQGWASPKSPTQQIHYNVVNELAKVQHNHPMLSLDKTKSLDELREFCGNRSAFRRLPDFLFKVRRRTFNSLRHRNHFRKRTFRKT